MCWSVFHSDMFRIILCWSCCVQRTHMRSLTQPLPVERLQPAGLFDVSQSVQYSAAWNGSQFLPINQQRVLLRLHLASHLHSSIRQYILVINPTGLHALPSTLYEVLLLLPEPQSLSGWAQAISWSFNFVIYICTLLTSIIKILCMVSITDF